MVVNKLTKVKIFFLQFPLTSLIAKSSWVMLSSIVGNSVSDLVKKKMYHTHQKKEK